ncbi:MOSC domain-containing protein [Paraburkholderia sp. MMS20-SJTN17]|uniref:MOSC domain-containing protein n=1 Tax=Paraburkholderia translucens TaxID=2886945 RepID=A0ABS8K825_9BURK|nr:MOSC and FAD-binding oxidoreductase domain-containing protein [Paraburkholderia sp. MMS20-SJTN17]MCC8400901.1 MOSC domain-containing protein [Paraburkholderia sp. MMS20-SJTN17]
MARLLSVNVGLPRDIEWKGRTVHTGIWKDPVRGRCRAGRLNLDGDGQGDLAGHGGEQRAVFVYQIESSRYWQVELKRHDLAYGQFGENFTIEGLPDSDVCIGDRYRIGDALFEVTQPRVTCYRVGIRMNEPRMPALLTSSGRPGFYFRVLREGEVGAGDEIVKVGEAKERMTVAQVNALLYSAHHPRDQLERALRIEALSPGWRWSFEALLKSSAKGGNAGLAPAAAANPAAPGFRPLTVTAIEPESADVLSLSFKSADGQPLQPALPGQYVVLRLQRTAGGQPLFRSYSISGGRSPESYRISVKIEPNGAAGTYLEQHVRVGDTIDVSSPRGSFVLQPGDGPVVLLSAGIGATPVLSMLHALSAARSTRQVLWLHAAHDGQHHPFAAEARRLMPMLAHGRSYVCYSTPDTRDRKGVDFDATGRLSQAVLHEAGVTRDADIYLCGPTRFMDDMKAALAGLGVAPERIHAEIFNGGESLNPGIVGTDRRSPHLPKDDANTGPLVSFARSGIAAHWNPSVYQSVLELAEACDVPVRWSCRTGVCHNCESGLVSGAVAYGPEPLDKPAEGNLLVCCSQPVRDIVVDL